MRPKPRDPGGHEPLQPTQTGTTIKNRYEALLVLDARGKDEDIKEIIERLERDFEKEGAKIEQIQKMDRHNFSYVAGDIDAGFYANFVFSAEPPVLDKLKAKFKLDDQVRQHYQRLRPRKKAVAKAG